MSTDIKSNLSKVEDNIIKACQSSNRDREDVTLIAVSKTKPVSDIEIAYNCGIRDFGENKAQELKSKYDKLPKDIRWHFIGHLQTNKVKYVVGKAYLIHSIDTYHLAEAVSKESVKKDVVSDILVEVNVAGEETKFGLDTLEVIDLIKKISDLPNINVKGLMTIAPFTSNPEENREYFEKLHQLLVDIKGKNIDNISMSVLSMGMTNDYMVAIEEGATYVRIGTGIFGERNYNIT